jgi:hypothetical protein
VRIPTEPLARRQLFEELVRQCTASRMNRFTFYQALRNYYLFGAADNKGAPYNKIGSTVDTLCSFIYSPDTTRFSLHLGTTATETDIFKSVPLSKEVTDQWRISRTNLLFSLALRWACVFGCMLVKGQWNRSGFRSYLVEPHQFGVLREDIVELTDQEAFTHHYTITKTQLESTLAGNPRKDRILAELAAGGTGEVPRDMSEGLNRLILGGPVGGVPGSLATGSGMSSIDGGLSAGGAGPAYDYTPSVATDLIDMVELYVWNDETQEHQLVTMASPGVVIFDRPASRVGHVKGLPPFVAVRPSFNLYDYFWGDSFVARLTWLQDWRTKRISQIMDLMERQIDPPTSITGGVGIAEEKLSALRRAGGQVSFPTPTAKVEIHRPDMPADLFAEIGQIDAMFDDTAGLGHVLQGKGEPGVRSRGQADLMARLGSARPKERAIMAEEAAEDLARLILRTVQDHSSQRFEAEVPGGAKKLTFIAEQFTTDYEVKVDAHSSSPIFVEDRKHDAVTLLEAHAIDRETLLDLFDPPNLQELKERLKGIEKKEAEAHKEEMQVMAQGGHVPKGKK